MGTTAGGENKGAVDLRLPRQIPDHPFSNPDGDPPEDSDDDARRAFKPQVAKKTVTCSLTGCISSP